MGLFTRMFGTTEKGETPASGETEQGSDPTQWPYLAVPVEPDGSAPVRNTSVPPPLPPARTRETDAAPPPDAPSAEPARALPAWPTGRLDEPAPQLDSGLFSASVSLEAADGSHFLRTDPATRDAAGQTAPGPAAASTAVSVVRALQTIFVQTPELAPTTVAPEQAPDDEIELALDWLAPETPVSGIARSLLHDQPDRLANTERFLVLAVERAPPLRELMLALALGPTTKRYLEQGKPVLASLLEAARQLEQVETSALLASLEEAMTAAAKERGSKVADGDRDALLAAYARLAQALPVAFDLAGEREQREPLLVHYLLRQVPDVHQLTIDKLRAAGYDSLEALCRSSAADLVAIGRIDTARADAISRRFRSYCRERTERSHEQVKPKLRALLDRLTRAHAEYERADAAEERAKKRSARIERRAASLELNLLLVQIGEIELVESLERSPTERKIEIVRRYLGHPLAGSGTALGGWT